MGQKVNPLGIKRLSDPGYALVRLQTELLKTIRNHPIEVPFRFTKMNEIVCVQPDR